MYIYNLLIYWWYLFRITLFNRYSDVKDYSEPSSLCTICLNNCYNELVLLLKSLENVKCDKPIYILCDSLTKAKLSNCDVELDLILINSLDKYSNKDRYTLEKENKWIPLMLEKCNVLSVAIEETGDSLYVDSDTVFLSSIPKIEKTNQVGLSKHNIIKENENKYGIYNGGCVWTNNKMFLKWWSIVAYIDDRYMEQQCLDDVTNLFKTFIFPITVNFGYWRLSNFPERESFFTIKDNKIQYKNEDLISIHTHFFTSKKSITHFNKFILKKINKCTTYDSIKHNIDILYVQFTIVNPYIKNKMIHHLDGWHKVIEKIEENTHDINYLFSWKHYNKYNKDIQLHINSKKYNENIQQTLKKHEENTIDHYEKYGKYENRIYYDDTYINKFNYNIYRWLNKDLNYEFENNSLCKDNNHIIRYIYHFTKIGINEDREYKDRLIRIDVNVDDTFLFDYNTSVLKTLIPYRHKWIGFVHLPLYINKELNILDVFTLSKNELFIESLKYCKGLFCFSKEVAVFLQNKFGVSTKYILHPCNLSYERSFNINEFQKNKQIVFPGKFLRRFDLFEKVKCNYNKVLLDDRLSNSDYINMLCSSLIINDYYNVTCNNVILECITFNTPVLCRYSEDIEEYLGKDYPLYFSNLNELQYKINNIELIKQANIYLKKMDKTKFSYDKFIETLYSINILI
jgi:hypothetical protein